MDPIYREDSVSRANPLSQAVKSHNFVFVSGQTGRDPETREIVSASVSEQTHQIFSNVAPLLEEAGLSLDDIVRITVYLEDLDDKDEFNQAYQEALSEPYPARAVIGGNALSPGAKVELEITAEL
ncbi:MULTISPECIES: RidA family protein [Salinibaculum]|uniref:RidA family protein n=1 Tax=Salinibaculum TaxID=2732368 RepID=UPI0030CEBF4F